MVCRIEKAHIGRIRSEARAPTAKIDHISVPADRPHDIHIFKLFGRSVLNAQKQRILVHAYELENLALARAIVGHAVRDPHEQHKAPHLTQIAYGKQRRNPRSKQQKQNEQETEAPNQRPPHSLPNRRA